MASELGALIHGAAEAKRRAFANEDFAGGYGRTVIGRVKRRRAVSATAAGGGAVVAVGALAVGGSHIVGPGFGFGDAGSPTSVVCTTAAGASPEWMQLGYQPGVAEGSYVPIVVERDGVTVTSPSVTTITVLEQASGKTTFIDVLDEGITVRVRTGGTESAVKPNADGTYTVRLSDEHSVTLRITLAAGVPRGEGNQTMEYRSPSIEVTIGASYAPEVTCATITPEPSGSPDPQISRGTPQPSASQTASAKRTPFQCGYVFSTAGRSNADIEIGHIEWMTADDAVAAIGSQWEHPEDAPLQVSGDQVPVTQIQLVDTWLDDTVPGMLLLGDPTDLGGATTADQFREDIGNYQVGMRYVLANDGTVVATMLTRGDDQSQYMESNPYGALLYGLDLKAAMVACDGVDEATLATADVIAVAGITYVDGDEIKGPFFAWNEAVRP